MRWAYLEDWGSGGGQGEVDSVVREDGQVPPVVRIWRCHGGRLGLGAAGGDDGNPEDGVWRGLRSSPCQRWERHWSSQAVMLGERVGVKKGICWVDRAVWWEAQAGQLCFSGRHPSLRFHLPRAGEVLLEALVAFPIGGS